MILYGCQLVRGPERFLVLLAEVLSLAAFNSARARQLGSHFLEIGAILLILGQAVGFSHLLLQCFNLGFLFFAHARETGWLSHRCLLKFLSRATVALNLELPLNIHRRVELALDLLVVALIGIMAIRDEPPVVGAAELQIERFPFRGVVLAQLLVRDSVNFIMISQGAQNALDYEDELLLVAASVVPLIVVPCEVQHNLRRLWHF
mmetsp:Transcript_26665/g.35676  ORF Transcript_26665/g.35676 Transcript_26665/m.35676 type:complete len:205 (-) Transcript_26665:259-873(-)